MPNGVRVLTWGSLAAVAALTLAVAAQAQTQQKSAPVETTPVARPPVAAPQSPGGKTSSTGTTSSTTSGPQFRDPKSGQIWTPDIVGQGKPPTTYEDRAFDPNTQAVASGAVADQTPAVQRIGTVPITAGPTVPLVVIDDLQMVPTPGDYWQLTIRLTNNSANTYSPIFTCHFDNGSKPVSRTRVLVPTTMAGERLMLTVKGPRTTLYVDRAGCDLTSP